MDKHWPNTRLDGFEPSTFRLTAERANRLRHRDIGNSFVIRDKMSVSQLCVTFSSPDRKHNQKC